MVIARARCDFLVRSASFRQQALFRQQPHWQLLSALSVTTTLNAHSRARERWEDGRGALREGPGNLELDGSVPGRGGDDFVAPKALDSRLLRLPPLHIRLHLEAVRTQATGQLQA